MYSGLNYEMWISRLTEAQKVQVAQMQRQQSGVQARKIAWSTIQSGLNSLNSAAADLRLTSTFRARAVTSSDITVLKATASPDAPQGAYAVRVDWLAQAHQIASANASVTDAAAALGVSGTVTIGDLKGFTIATTDSLNSLRDRINATSQAITAQVVATGTGYQRLVLTSRTLGKAGAIALQDDTTTKVLQSLGLADATGTAPANELAAARNASFGVNGATYERATNSVSDVVPGLTLNLLKAGDSTVTVSADNARVVAAARSLVDSFNKVLAELDAKAAPGGDKGPAGPLATDSLARQLRNELKEAVLAVVPSLPESLRSLSQVGISFGAWGSPDYGKLVLNETTLNTRLAENPDGVARLFGALDINAAKGGTATERDASNQPVASSSVAVVNDGVADPGVFWTSANPVSAGSPTRLEVTFSGLRTIDRVRVTMPNTDTLKDFSLEYRDASGAWHAFEPAVSVRGNTAATRVVSFTPTAMTGVRLVITASNAADGKARVAELEALEPGVAGRVSNVINLVNRGTDGAIPLRQKALDDRILEMDRRITRLNESLERQVQTLRNQFDRLETAMARLRNQGNALLSQMGVLMTSQY